jgi:uncharacterized C2H2 Zn-finger protein
MPTRKSTNRTRRGLTTTIRSLLEAKEALAALERRFLVDLLGLLPNGTVPGGKAVVAKKGRGSAPGARRLKCPKCARQFRLPMHLGRHIASTHQTKRKRAA